MLIIDLQGFLLFSYSHSPAFSRLLPAFLAKFWLLFG
jgi:hypothetical protein